MAVAADFADHYDYSVRASDDASTHSHSATGWSHRYEQVLASRFRGIHAEAWLGSIQVIYERIDGAYRYCGRPWEGARVFLSFLPGSGEILCNGRPVATGALLTYRWNTTYRVTCSRLTETLVVAVNESVFERYASRHAKGVALDREQRLPLICAQEPNAVAEFERSVLSTLRMMGETRSLRQDERARQTMRQSVLAALCDALLGEAPDENQLPSASTRAYVVEKAIRFIETRLADPLSVEEISAAVRVCPRTLRYSFETVLGLTPTQYMRAQRLRRVRRDLLAGSDESIQGAATRWGFWHMGRFAKYYRQTFGELPSHTIHASARQHAAASAASTSAETSLTLPPCFYRVANERLSL